MGMLELFPFFWKDVMWEDMMPGASTAILWLIGALMGWLRCQSQRWNEPWSTKTSLKAGVPGPGSPFSGLSTWDDKSPTFQAILVGVFCYMALKSTQVDSALGALCVFILFSDTVETRAWKAFLK